MVAAVVARFADQQQHPAMIGRLLFQQIHRIADGIENRRSPVASRHSLQITGDRIFVVPERFYPGRFRIEGHQRHLPAPLPGEELEQRSQLADLVELQRRIAPAFHAHHQRNRLRVQVGVDLNLLLHAVIED